MVNNSTEATTARIFALGERIYTVGVYGGVTWYKVEAIERDTDAPRVLLSEIWEDYDGTGTRPAQWHDLTTDTDGNERAFDWHSDSWDRDFYIWA